MMKNRSKLNPLEEEWTVKEPGELLEFLFRMMPARSKKSVKSLLGRGQIRVNSKASTQFNEPLRPGDRVQIEKRTAKHDAKIKGLKILHEDSDIIVIEKDAGILSIASEKENQMTAYRQLSDYMQSIHPKNRIFIVHRLDRDTSGIMMFAKNKKIQQKLQDNWQDIITERTYIAVVEGIVKEDGTIISWLTENKSLMVRSSKNPNKGKKAITHYKVLKNKNDLSLLQVKLDTGRKNQIRVHMQDLKHPIVGDKKYGSQSNPLKRVGLHAHAIGFKHPVNGEHMRFESKIPVSFTRKF